MSSKSITAIAVGLLALGCAAAAQDYPAKPIRMITSAVGSGSDFDARLIAPALSGAFGQQVIVDNRNGTLLSAEAGAKSPPDGYTVIINGGSFWLGPLLQKMSYDPVRDSATVSMLEQAVNVVAVHPSLPVKSMRELIALAKSRPGELNYASPSIGAAGHLAGEMLRSMAGIHIVRVNYKSTSGQTIALLTGEVQMMFPSAGLVAAHAKSGRIRLLAVTGGQPSVLAPGLPTVASAGLPGYEVVSLTGLFVPAKTPAAIIGRLNQEIVRVLNRPEIKERFIEAWLEPIGNSPEAAAAAMKSDIARVEKLIRDAGIKAE
jgi:tripartite-type tricarboxylate transporter receptor subunit TctC